ncbi:unnamed protein product [Urochloa humidicola]
MRNFFKRTTLFFVYSETYRLVRLVIIVLLGLVLRIQMTWVGALGPLGFTVVH